jgi:hypothetical protein
MRGTAHPTGRLEAMSETKLVRPPQVTVAGWLVVGGSVLVVLMAFSEVAGLRSIETRESVAEYFSRPPLDDLGVGVQGGLDTLRVTLMLTAACAAATAILGWQVLQRSRGARVASSLLAVPLFLSGLVVSGLVGGGMFSSVVVAAIVMLWFQPARDWFDGVTRAPAPAPERPPAAPDPVRNPAREPSRESLLDLPPPTAPPIYPTTYAADPADAAPADSARPASVTWACAVTWLCTALVFGVMALALVQLLATPDVYVDEFHRQNPDLTMTDADVRAAMGVLIAVCLVWSAVAAALAALVWRGVSRAVVPLVASAALACVTLFPLVACVATIVLLFRPDARAWFRRSGRPSRAG